MVEAWQKRGLEQQELLERIMTDAFRAIEDGDHDTFFLMLTMELARNLIARRLTAQGPVPAYLNVKSNDQLVGSFCNKFMTKIKDFCRTPEEEHELLARLLTKFAEAGLSEIHSAYLRQTVHEQEKLYEGHRAMDEVPFS